MHSPRRFVGVALSACLLGGLAAVVGFESVASATPTQLVVPQGTAFSFVGHSCGGIQEQVFATGFDPTSTFPQGDAYLSTRCGGSGRDGGGVSTLYSAWVAATWDFTGALVSAARLSGVPSVNPTFSTTDSNGNNLYNLSNHAYLVLATGWTPAPRVTGLSTSIGPSSGGTSMTISGTGLTGATAVDFNGTDVTPLVVSDAAITVVTPAVSITGTTSTIDVIVTTAGGPSAPTTADTFTFVAAPSISSLSPNSGDVSGATSVTITGTHLAPVTSVMFGDQGAGFIVNDDTSITAYAPASDSGVDSTSVIVTSIGGTSNALQYDYTNTTPPYSGPVVTALSPASGPAGGRTKVTVSGQSFAGATAVTFGGVPALSFVVDSTGTIITALSPPDSIAVGTAADVQVTGPGGTSPVSAADVFTYVAPVITKVGPRHGPAAGGTRVHIRGSDLAGATAVTFGGVPAARFTVNRAGTVITAVAPPEAGVGTQSVDVSVTNVAGTGTMAASYTYQ